MTFQTILPDLRYREPLVDEKDFDRFVSTVGPLMRPGRDVLWVLCGRTLSNHQKLKKMDKHRLTAEHIIMTYDTRLMQQYGFWKRQRGIANSKSVEQAWFVYKGRMPKMPKERQFVDVGSSLFQEVMRNVPVLNPRHQAFVSRDVRETSLMSMAGTPNIEFTAELERERKLQDAAGDQGEGLHQPEEMGEKMANISS